MGTMGLHLCYRHKQARTLAGGPRSDGMGYQLCERSIAKQVGAAKSSPTTIARNTLGPVVPNAGAAEHVARKPRQQLIVLVNLRQLRPVLPLSTGIANGAPPMSDLSADEMRAMIVVLEADALTPAPLRMPGRADANLIDLAGLAAARD
jgi:hypothetical protein